MNPPGKKKSIAIRNITSDPQKYITQGGTTRLRTPDMLKGVSGRQRKKLAKAQRRRVKAIQAMMDAPPVPFDELTDFSTEGIPVYGDTIVLPKESKQCLIQDLSL